MNPTKGILSKITALALFSVMASLIKASAPHVPPWEAVFFRSFFALPVMLIWLWRRGDLNTGLNVQNPMGHFWRGFIGTTAMIKHYIAVYLDTFTLRNRNRRGILRLSTIFGSDGTFLIKLS